MIKQLHNRCHHETYYSTTLNAIHTILGIISCPQPGILQYWSGSSKTKPVDTLLNQGWNIFDCNIFSHFVIYWDYKYWFAIHWDCKLPFANFYTILQIRISICNILLNENFIWNILPIQIFICNILQPFWNILQNNS